MPRIISSRAPHLVSRVRPTSDGTSKLLRRVYAYVSTRPCPDVHRQFLSHAAFSSSRQMMKSLGDSKQLAQPALFRHMASTLTGNAGADPYRYTSGRWLRRDALERESRLIHFDFDALCRRVLALCPGASSVTSYDKKEGGFNRVFIFHTDNAKRIVAKLPFALAGPSRLTTNSEVATIKYHRFCTDMGGWKWALRLTALPVTF
jgi:hypothetical protein